MDTTATSNEEWMHLAILQAELALNVGEVPVGCVIVRNNQAIGQGFNKTNELKNVLPATN